MTLWTLMSDALRNLERIKRDPRYVIDLDRWHKPMDDGCHVCLAGATLIGILEPEQDLHGQLDYKALRTLDALARGDIRTAYVTWYERGVEQMPRNAPHFASGFKNTLEALKRWNI